MPTHVAGIIRVASVAENILGAGATVQGLRRAIAPIAPPEGRYGPLRWSIINDQTNSHDQQWGYWTIGGDLAEFGDSEPVREYWRYGPLRWSIIKDQTNSRDMAFSFNSLRRCSYAWARFAKFL